MAMGVGITSTMVVVLEKVGVKRNVGIVAVQEERVIQ